MELVVLVDEQNNVLGTAPKDEVHTKDTPLHRAFSLFLFNSQGQLLVTKRATTKKTFPSVWTNTVCGHPRPNESNVEAVRRRLKIELGISLRPGLKDSKGQALSAIREVAPYRYRFTDQNGIVENEICPILVAYTDSNPTPDPAEVEDWKWVTWDGFLAEIKAHPELYSPWCIEEATIFTSHHIPI